MNAIIAAGIILALFSLVFWWMRKAKKEGKTEARAEYQDETIKNVKKIRAARDSITDDERKRLRERYDIK